MRAVKIGIENYSEAIRLDPRLAKAYYGRAISWTNEYRQIF